MRWRREAGWGDGSVSVCDKCGGNFVSLAQYASGWGEGAFGGGLFGPWLCDGCAPKGAYAISARVDSSLLREAIDGQQVAKDDD